MSVELEPANCQPETTNNCHWLVFDTKNGAPFNAYFPIGDLSIDKLINGPDHANWGRWNLGRYQNPNFSVGSGLERYLCALEPRDVMGFLTLFEEKALSSIKREGYLPQLRKFLDNRDTPLSLGFIKLMSQILEMLLAEARAIESSAGRNYFYSPDGKMVEVPDNRLSRHTSYTDFIKRHPPLVTTELISPEPGIISLERVIGKPQYKSPVSIEPPGGNIDTIPYLNITAEIGRFGDPIARFILRNLSLPINRRFY